MCIYIFDVLSEKGNIIPMVEKMIYNVKYVSYSKVYIIVTEFSIWHP